MPVKYQELVERVQDRTGTPDVQDAREATGAVLGTLLDAAAPDERTTLLGALPGPVQSMAEVPGPGPLTDLPGLLDEVGRRTNRPPEQARYLVQAVLDVLAEQDPELTARIEALLPDAVIGALRPAGDPPGEAVTTTPERPTALTADEVSRALAGLEGWTGDERGISRTVVVPPDRVPDLVDRVQAEARRSNDHAHVRQEQDAVTFVLHTRGSEVTEPDVELAGRIDAVVAGRATGG